MLPLIRGQVPSPSTPPFILPEYLSSSAYHHDSFRPSSARNGYSLPRVYYGPSAGPGVRGGMKCYDAHRSVSDAASYATMGRHQYREKNDREAGCFLRP